MLLRTKRYGTGVDTNETVQYFNGTVNGSLLHYYLLNFVVNTSSHV